MSRVVFDHATGEGVVPFERRGPVIEWIRRHTDERYTRAVYVQDNGTVQVVKLAEPLHVTYDSDGVGTLDTEVIVVCSDEPVPEYAP